VLKKPLQRLVSSLGRRLFDVYCDPVQAMRLAALDKTVAYIKTHARDALCLRNREKLLAYAVSRAPAAGLVAEFGVHKGASVNYLAQRVSPRTVYGFDSFRGNPEDWAGWDAPRGVFDLGGRLPKVRPNVTLVPGWFEETLPAFKAEHADPVALLHIDCDLYSSTKCVFDHLGDRLRSGSILVFDEYFNYVNWEEHEHRAFQELAAARQLRYRYLAYSTRQVVVAIDGAGRC
jgi:predicted O-methyltransferase YrrM